MELTLILMIKGLLVGLGTGLALGFGLGLMFWQDTDVPSSNED